MFRVIPVCVCFISMVMVSLAGHLTNAQLLTFKNDIAANTNTVSFGGGNVQVKDLPHNDDGAEAVAKWYSLNATPAVYVWKTSLPEDEITQKTGSDLAAGGAATNWAWTGSGFITRTQGERDAWARIFRSGACNPSLSNVRQAFADILSGGTAPAPANRNHLLVMSKRPATNYERLFWTTAGAGAGASGAYATPMNVGTSTVDATYLEGPIDRFHILEAWNQ